MGGLHGYIRLLGLGCRRLLCGLNRGRGGVEGGIGCGGVLVCLRALLRLRGPAVVGGRCSAAGAKALIIF